MLAIYMTLAKKQLVVIGLLLGGAFLARPHTILSLPFFMYPIFENHKKELAKIAKDIFYLGLGIAPFVFANFLYNYVRFGTIFDKGYILIPGVLAEPWFDKGLFHFSYTLRHLKVMFLALPKFSNTYPFISPSLLGLAIWITTPTFVYAFKAGFETLKVKLAWISIALVALVVFMHSTTGFTQFGYRYAVDFYPFLIYLTILGVSKSKLKYHHWLLLLQMLGGCYGLINLVGELINKAFALSNF